MKKSILFALVLTLLLTVLTSCSLFAATEVKAETLSGYIMDAHCFIKKPDPGSDSKTCLQMPACAATGFGLAVKQADDTYKFYFFDGTFAPEASDAQEMAIDLINNTTRKDHIYITVTGTITGETKKVADGVNAQVIKVSEMKESDE